MSTALTRTASHYLPAALSGTMMVLIFPRAGLHFLAWVCLVPLIADMLYRPQRSVFLRGLVAGTMYHIGLLYWVIVAMSTYGGVPRPIAGAVLIAFALFLSLFVALPLWCSDAVRRRTAIRSTVSLPVFWIAFEYIKSWILTGFPWQLMGYSQFKNLRLIQIADITGVYGISFMIVCVNCALALIVCALLERRRLPIAEPCMALLLVGISLFYGHARVQQFHDPAGPRINALLVQPNIPQNLKWDPGYLDETMQRLLRLSTAHTETAPDLIIWPESATPFFFQSEPVYHEYVLRTLRQSGAWLLFGSPSFTRFETTHAYYNSAFLMRPDGRQAGRYDKVHLVPWGEYVPLQQLFPFINRLVAGIGDFSPGTGIRLLLYKDIPLAPLICYEIIFPNLTRSFIRKGGQYIVNITNDAWFGTTCAPYQHLSMAVLRAVENKRCVLRAANTGISAAIAPSGKIIARTPLFTETALPATLPAMTVMTLYTRFGDVFAALCLLAAAVLMAAAYRRTAPMRRT